MLRMRSLFKGILSVGFLCLTGSIAFLAKADNSRNSSNARQAQSRSFELGFAPIPRQPSDTQSWLDTIALLSKNSEFILHHSKVDWPYCAGITTAENSAITQNLNFITGLAKEAQLSLFLVIDPLETHRERIDPDLAPTVGTNFADRLVRQAFTNCALRIAQTVKPAYLALGSEINTYILKNPQDSQNLVSLYTETYRRIKQEIPELQMSTTFQFELLNGTFSGLAQWSLLEELEPSLDFIAISTYPSPWFKSPKQIPRNYYRQLRKHSAKPIVIAESGWPSGGDRAYHGSQHNQNQFIKQLPRLSRGIDLRLWIWWFLHDWASGGYGDFFNTMGLRYSDGGAKRSWYLWQQLKARPKF